MNTIIGSGYYTISVSNELMKFVKRLSPSEAKYKYLGLNKEAISELPPKQQVFKLKFKNKTYDMKVNNKNCIMLTQLYYVYQFVEGDEITITKNKNETFEITVNSVKNII